MPDPLYHTPDIPSPELAGGGEFVPMRMENDAILQRVSRELYAKPESGLRELLANEITAARKARSLGGNPTIEVTIRPDMIRVQGFDSLGIDRKTFEGIYLCLGRSGNFDGKTPGQFGLGRASYVTISDRILIETNPRGEDPYSFVGIEGRGYQMGLTPPDIPVGTRATLAPRDTRRSTLVAMAAMACGMAGMTDIPVALVTRDGTSTPPKTSVFDGCVAGETRDGIEVAIHSEYRWDTYLCGVPIDFHYDGQYRIRGISVNILDERRYPPTPDRERLTGEAEAGVSRVVNEIYGEYLAGISRRLTDIIDRPDAEFAASCVGKLGAYFKHVSVYGLDQSMSISAIKGRPLLECGHFDDIEAMEAVRRRHPGATFVRGSTGLETLYGFCDRTGIPHGKPAASGIVLHGRNGPRRFKPGKSRYRVYRVGGMPEIRAERNFLKANSNVRLTVHDFPGARPLREARGEARGKIWRTSRGEMSGSSLEALEIPVYRSENESLVEHWGDGIPEIALRGGTPHARPAESVLVLDGGSEEYSLLCGDNIEGHPVYCLPHWDRETAMEAYLRLETPAYRFAIMLCPRVAPDILDMMLVEEGKGPVTRSRDRGP